jgi:hypothetical protein
MAGYRLQGGAYAYALAKTLGRPVSRVELVFAALGQSASVSNLDGVVARVERLLA